MSQRGASHGIMRGNHCPELVYSSMRVKLKLWFDELMVRIRCTGRGAFTVRIWVGSIKGCGVSCARKAVRGDCSVEWSELFGFGLFASGAGDAQVKHIAALTKG